MPVPPDHAALLRRTDYPVPADAPLTVAERHTVARFGYWMDALTTGAVAPATAEQERFVRAARGQEPPESAFEVAWAKARPPAHGVPPTALATHDHRPQWVSAQTSLTTTAKKLEEVRAAAIAIRQEDLSRRLDILAKVQPEIDALDAEMSARLKPLEAEVARLEAALKDGVRLGQKTFWYRGIRVTFAKGRVTFDNKALQVYAESHPEINRFRKVGQPVVSLRYTLPGESQTPPHPSADEPGPEG